MHRRPIPASLLVLLLLAAAPDAAGKVRLGVTAELGPELDTNSTRVQSLGSASANPAAVSSGLLRLTARADLRLALAGRHLLHLGYGGGGKWFWDDAARGADELVQHADLGWAVNLGGVQLRLAGAYYDAYQRSSTRDLRLGSGTLTLGTVHRPSRLQLLFSAGYRGLQYKPDLPRADADCLERPRAECARYSQQGPFAGLWLGWARQSGDPGYQVDWRLSLAYTATLRAYDALLRGPLEQCIDSETLGWQCTWYKAGHRSDLHHRVVARVDYLGNADASLWYQAEINHSNSYGETFVRHSIGIKFTAELIWQVTFTAKGILLLSRFSDPYSLSQSGSQTTSQTFIDIENENRSSMVLQLARDISEHFAVNLRYALYINETTALPPIRGLDLQWEPPTFRRQTLFAGVRLNYDL